MRLNKYLSLLLILTFTLVLMIAPMSSPLLAEDAPPPDTTPSFAVGSRANYYPIVLIGGMTAWGRDEMLGIKYFGGLTDLQVKLTNAGFPTYTAAPGPFSSYYDRACEVYAHILGKKADYGIAHANYYHHDRWGHDYSNDPLIKDWGTPSNPKINMIVHSMGGPTARALVQLLENGSPEEIKLRDQLANDNDPNTNYTDFSGLFEGNHHWVRSVMTISSPHDGTTLAPALNGIPFLQQLASLLIGTFGGGNCLYDFKLEQFHLTKTSSQTWKQYRDMVFQSPLWNGTLDWGNYDGSPEGTRDFNGWAKAQPDVYYFSWATCGTVREPFTGHQVARLSMFPIFVLWANHMGAYTCNKPGKVPIDSSWWKNDGVVNTNSMDGPTLNSTDQIVTFGGIPQIGKWNYMGLRDGWDHADIIGCGTLWPVTNWYISQAKLLASLPK
ncbi:MAG: esterase/lipase family protein [Candidatus Saccharibacteria bacterium]